MVSVLSLAVIVGVQAGSVAALTATPNILHGQADFRHNCLMCHTVNEGEPNKIGPNLYGVVGRKAASLPNFHYSAVMRASNLTWTPDVLSTYLRDPKKLVPGTFMTFRGFMDPIDIRDIVGYLATRKPAPAS